MSRDGILNGLVPWRAEWRFVGSKWMGEANVYDGFQWCVVDAEDSLSAIVQGGEEMAEFIAQQLNALSEPQDGEPER